jgi:hypothetical protein
MKQQDALKQLYHVLEAFDGPSLGYNQNYMAAHEIRLAANRLNRIAERECNGIERIVDGIRQGTWTDADQAKADKERAAAEKKVQAALSKAMGDKFPSIAIEFQGDPRGCPVIIHTAGKQDRIAAFG